MKDPWKDFDKDNWKDSWDLDRYKPLTLGEAYGNKKIGGPFLEFRWLRQAAVAIVLFFVFLVFFTWDSPKAASLQQNIRYLLVEEQSDFTPVLEAMVKDGLWLDTYDREVYEKEVKQVTREKSPMSIPVSGKFARHFGWVESSVTGKKTFHAGIDIETELGAPVRAALDGTVLKVEETRQLGRVVEIDHGNGLTTVYGTLGEILVAEKQQVKQGEIIAKTGTIIKSKKGQLHFEIREKGKAVDPLTKITDVRTSI
ncbi:M23 family metallopeptidase [Zhaonella formicivorans]|uniref:M23 family metallopeptidase n=1 Tax=Zhaonella formicivorans TaxID=2528593 RepID=UPI0010E5E987|nr:M23 family metallopeptidase [Zhaonella formicivorans]